MKDKEIKPETLMDESILESTGNNDEILSSLVNMQELRAEDLKAVYAWSPTQRNKIDNLLKKKMNGEWPTDKKDEISFYSELLSLVVDKKKGEDLEPIMAKFSRQQPRGKKFIYNLWERVFVRVVDESRKVDYEQAEPLIDSLQGNDKLGATISDLTDLLADHGREEFNRVFDGFIKKLSDDENIESLDELSLSDEWREQKSNLDNICLELRSIIENLALGLKTNDKEIDEKLKELKNKSAELRQNILSFTEEYNFQKEIWTDNESFEQYCEELEKFIECQSSENNLISFYEDLIAVIKSIDIEHPRSPRTADKLTQKLQKIIEELNVQRNSDSPYPFPGPQETDNWFDWVFSLEGEKLEEIQDELDENFPVFADFIGECDFDWLHFGKIAIDQSKVKKEKEALSTEAEIQKSDTGKNSEVTVEDAKVEDPGNVEEQSSEVTLEEESLLAGVDSRTNPIEPLEEKVLEENLNHVKSVEENGTPLQILNKELNDDSENDNDKIVTESIDEDIPSPSQELPKSSVLPIKPSENLKEEEFFETCLNYGNFSKAYWVAASCDVKISPELIGAVALGSQIGIGSSLPGQLQSYLGELVTHTFDELSSKLLLFSAISGVSLFTDPSSNEVYTLIEYVDSGITAVDELARFIKTDFVYKGISIQPDDVNCVLSTEELEQKLLSLKERSTELLHRARSADFTNYVPAKSFLRYLYREGSELAGIHLAIEKNNLSKANEVHSLIRDLTGESLVSEAPSMGVRKCIKPFTGKARSQLIRRINDTIAIGREWHNLIAGSLQGQKQVQKENLLSHLKALLNKSVTSLNNFEGDQFEKISASVTSKCFSMILKRLEGELTRNFIPLSNEIIGIADIVLDDDFEIESDSKDCLICELEGKGDNATSISLASFKKLVDRQEFLRAKVVADIFSLERDYIDLLEQQVEDEKRRMLIKIDELSNKVEDAYLLGQLSEPEIDGESSGKSQESLRSEFIGRLNTTEKRINNSSDKISWRSREINFVIDDVDNQLRFIEQKYQERINYEFGEIIKQFPSSESGAEDKKYVKGAFQEASEQGDKIAALEILNRAKESIQSGTPIPRTSIGENQELDRFLEKIDQYQEALRQKGNIGKYILKMQQRKTVAGINFGTFDKAHLKKAVDGVSAWWNLLKMNYRNSDKQLLENIDELLNFLDINSLPKTLTLKSEIDDDFIYLYTKFKFPIDCSPVPAFGSSLGNGAHIVVSKNKKEPDQLFSFLGRHELQYKPTILFYLQEIGIRQRLKYQRYFAKKKLSVLLIDLCLAFHLCGSRNRLPVLLDIALPFSCVQPYMMKGENVPKETFVGRDDEVKSLLDPNGSCIVFGGRQLGKSALLRHVYKTYNKPEKNVYIAYLDIDGLGMDPQTHEQMMDVFWKNVHRDLCREGFLEEKTINHRKKAQAVEEEVINEIINTLAESQEKRLYLLLDETDHFLDNDSSLNFSIVRSLRGLMATTDRHFKVVLAGLQSVQRYNNWKNHPFAQLGSDLVIKPLDPNSAQKLILRPLNSLGFVFEKTGLMLRILSQANYHPGLIQIFCHRLLERLYSKWGNKSSDHVIRKVVLDDLLTIERDPNFIEDIRNRFDWTLDLDDRYKVLIYALVLTEDQTGSRSEREFMNIACYWWPQVFEKMDQQALRAVLDEMVGLGVLVREDDDAVRMYRLKSPNLLRLLGTREQIEDELQRIISLDKPRILNSRNFHSKIKSKPLYFGPLTKEQEGQIDIKRYPVSITIISGSNALGLNSVQTQIEKILDDTDGEGKWHNFIIPEQIACVPDSLTSFVKKKLSPRNRDHLYVTIDLAVMPDKLNVSDLISELLCNVEKICTKKSRGQIFILVDPKRLWTWLAEPERESILMDQRITSIELKRWSDGALTNMLDNIDGVAGGKAYGEGIFTHTSGWHNLIQRGVNKLDSGADKNGKTNIVEIWAAQVDKFKEEFHDDPQGVLEEFGLVAPDKKWQTMMKKIFEWSSIDDRMEITRDVIELCLEDDKSTNAREYVSHFKSWLQLLDIVYRNDAGGPLIVEPIVCDAIKAGMFSEQ